jgi:hypothetical protein
MRTLRFIVVIFLLFSLPGCGSGSSAQRAKTLTTQGDSLLAQDTKVVAQWTAEYGQTFTPQKRAEFPSNREFLNSHAERVIMLLDESSRLTSAAADNYDQASSLMSSDKGRGMALLASSIRKETEVNELFKAQMRLASDQEIQNATTFNEKFMNLMELIKQKKKEIEDQQVEGKRLLGL